MIGLPDLPNAACANHADPEIWFPAKAGDANQKEAQAICRSCKDRIPCLTWALEHNEDEGIWGGERPRAYKAKYINQPKGAHK